MRLYKFRPDRYLFSPIQHRPACDCVDGGGVVEEKASVLINAAAGSVERSAFVLDGDFAAVQCMEGAEAVDPIGCGALGEQRGPERGDQFVAAGWRREMVGQARGAGADGIRRMAQVGADVEAEANEVRVAGAGAEQAGDLAAVDEDVVGPFHFDAVIRQVPPNHTGDGEAGAERDLSDRHRWIDGQDERGAERAGVGPPRVRALAAAPGLRGGGDDGRRGECPGLKALRGRSIGGPEAREDKDAGGRQPVREPCAAQRVAMG